MKTSHEHEPDSPSRLLARGLLLAWSLAVLGIFLLRARLPGPSLSHTLSRALELFGW